MTTPVSFEEDDIFLDPSLFAQEKKETFPEKVKRHSSRGLARSLETIAGLPGDMREFAQSLITKGFGALMGDQEKAQEISETIQPFVPGPLGMAPSSQQIREAVTQRLTGEYLEPQTRGEEIGDEIVSDLVALAIPVKGKIPFARALAGSLGGAAAKESIKSIGGGEKAQALGKLGTMFLLGNLGRQNARQYVRNLHKDAESLIPSNARISSRNLSRNLNNASKSIQSGGITPDKSHALNLMNQLGERIRSGRGEIDPREIRNFRHSVNELRFNRSLSDRARYYLDRFDDVLNEGLLEYGKENPSFLNKYREANLGTAGLKQSNKLARAISKKIDITKVSPEALILLGAHTQISPSLLAKLGVTAVGAKGAQLAKRLSSNSTLRTHYLNTIKAASQENWKSFSRNLNLMEKELGKEKKEKPEYEIMDFTEASP